MCSPSLHTSLHPSTSHITPYIYYPFPKPPSVSDNYYSFITMSMAFCIIATTLFMSLSFSSAQSSRAFFVFGDSLVDSGNNDFLATTARADAPPYGIDFPTHRPTGRFSNGLNIPDIISMSSCNKNYQDYSLLISIFLVVFYLISHLHACIYD